MPATLNFTNTGSYEVPATRLTDEAITSLSDQYGIEFSDVQSVIVSLYAATYAEDDIITKVENLEDIDWDGDSGYVEIATTETADAVLEALNDEFEDYFELGVGDAIGHLIFIAFEDASFMQKVAEYLEVSSGVFA